MREPPYLSGYLLNVGILDEVEARLLTLRLIEVPGVAEAAVAADEGVAYLKVDRRMLNETMLRQFAADPP
jgi:hypothetical protein